MLVLSRKVGEKLVIGDNITIFVNRVSGNRVTLAVKAPHDVRILRGELEPIAKEFEIETEVSVPTAAADTEIDARTTGKDGVPPLSGLTLDVPPMMPR